MRMTWLSADEKSGFIMHMRRADAEMRSRLQITQSRRRRIFHKRMQPYEWYNHEILTSIRRKALWTYIKNV